MLPIGSRVGTPLVILSEAKNLRVISIRFFASLSMTLWSRMLTVGSGMMTIR